MCDIDHILDLLDWNESDYNQQQGLKLAECVKSINVFIQPLDKGHNKNVWGNCAIVLSKCSDEQLRPYLDRLLEWLIDMNWPGAFSIYDRLKQFEDIEFLKYFLSSSINKAKALNENIWFVNLTDLWGELFDTPYQSENC